MTSLLENRLQHKRRRSESNRRSENNRPTQTVCKCPTQSVNSNSTRKSKTRLDACCLLTEPVIGQLNFRISN